MKAFLQDQKNNEEIEFTVINDIAFMKFEDKDNLYHPTEKDDYIRKIGFRLDDFKKSIIALKKIRTLSFELFLTEDSFNTNITDQKFTLNSYEDIYICYELQIEEHTMHIKQDELEAVIEAFDL
ncbi:hypothetical protein AAGG74_19145 [Bacillus mexicanus]|uniref:hypothetical protein n=1 Tax=Bacillus mexicanus TaxID=2834415 RepID=UPI003D1A9080